MKTKQIFFAVLSLVAFGFIFGCGKSEYPQGFPKIYKCSIKVVDGGTPLEGVMVKFESSDREANKWGSGGTTDADGIAVIGTRGFPGAPLGQFKVLLEKRGAPTVEVSPGIYQPTNAENELNPDYSNSDTTPFSINVEKKQAAVPTFDVADGTTK